MKYELINDNQSVVFKKDGEVYCFSLDSLSEQEQTLIYKEVGKDNYG